MERDFVKFLAECLKISKVPHIAKRFIAADEQLPDFKVQRTQRKRPFRLRKCLLYIAMRQRVRAAEDSGRLRMRMSCLVRIRQAEIFVIKFLPFPFREKACKLFCHLLPRFCLSA